MAMPNTASRTARMPLRISSSETLPETVSVAC